jgi:hypothetical protein
MQYPKRVTIELTNRCNRACIGCPRHKMRYPQGYMTPELFYKINRSCAILPWRIPLAPRLPHIHASVKKV